MRLNAFSFSYLNALVIPIWRFKLNPQAKTNLNALKTLFSFLNSIYSYLPTNPYQLIQQQDNSLKNNNSKKKNRKKNNVLDIFSTKNNMECNRGKCCSS